jgi:hypothetical protein
MSRTAALIAALIVTGLLTFARPLTPAYIRSPHALYSVRSLVSCSVSARALGLSGVASMALRLLVVWARPASTCFHAMPISFAWEADLSAANAANELVWSSACCQPS